MHQKYLFAALALAAAFPALAGTIATHAATSPHMTRLARADNHVTHAAIAGTGPSAIASDSTRQKNTPTAAAGGLLNTGTSPAQAKAIAKDTNRKIAQGQIVPQAPVTR